MVEKNEKRQKSDSSWKRMVIDEAVAMTELYTGRTD